MKTVACVLERRGTMAWETFLFLGVPGQGRVVGGGIKSIFAPAVGEAGHLPSLVPDHPCSGVVSVAFVPDSLTSEAGGR